jgi:hypothetical protein
VVSRVAAALLCAAVAGCNYLTGSFDTDEFSGDPFPILVDHASGALVVGVQESGSSATHQAVLDIMSPITLFDRGVTSEPRIDYRDLTLLGARTPGGPLDLPRAHLVDKRVLTLHPCTTTICTVGTEAEPRPLGALLGLDVFAGDALRLRLASDEIFVLPDIAGSEVHRGRSCDATLGSPFRGGGTLLLGGTEVSFTNWRIAIDACIAPRPARLITQSARGVDVLLVLSTAIGTSLLSETAYARVRALDPSLPALDALTVGTVLLPSGPVDGRLVDLPSIALVGNSGSSPRAPCRQMWASHLLAERDCRLGDDCPCAGESFCSVPAIVELAPATGIPVLVVPDSQPTLHALRTELRPDRPEVDGILGTTAIEALELDIDPAHDRLLARCVDRTTCGARAALLDRAARSYVTGCLGDMPGPIVFEDN